MACDEGITTTWHESLPADDYYGDANLVYQQE